MEFYTGPGSRYAAGVNLPSMSYLELIFSFIPFYLIGSIPSGYLLARRQGVDITRAGSGNIGATNVARIVGKRSGFYTLLVDISKGFIATVLGMAISPWPAYPAWVGLCAVLGHCFSIPGKFRGGKGVATALGVYLALTPLCALIGLLVFAGMFSWTKIVSVSSLCGAITIPLGAILLGASAQETIAMTLISIVVIYRHHENLYNLINGTEKKFSFKHQPNGGSPA